MDSSNQMKEVTVCIVSDTIYPDLSKCAHELSTIPTANPNLIFKNDGHMIRLWQQEVGKLDAYISLMIKEVSKLKMAKLKV